MKQLRFLGFDDSFSGERGVLVGVVTAGNCYVEGVMVDDLPVDGLDATERIIRMVNKSKFREQIRCIFLSGITYGGFNLADVSEISETLTIPVVVVMRKAPDFESIERALRNLENYAERMEILRNAGEVHEVGDVFVQFSGCTLSEAESFLKASVLKGNIPECLRIAHMIASAIIHGENRGRA